MKHHLPALLWLALFASFALAQSKREGSIAGRVLGDDGRPVAGVEVAANRIGAKRGGEHTALSDEEGRFQFNNLAPGVYSVDAGLPGFIVEGASRGGAVYRIGEQATIRLTKGCVITGRVTDETGDPLVAVWISSRRVRGLDVRSKDSPLSEEDLELHGGGGGATDDRGIYRIYGLPPGVYIVGVGVADWGDSSYLKHDAPTYYPSVPRDAAGEVTLRGSEEVSGIDIRHRGEPGHTLSGVVAGAIESSRTFIYVSIRLRSVEAGRFEAETGVRNSNVFVFSGVPDGEYDLQAMRPGLDDEVGARSSSRRISLKGADLTGIELKLLPLASIAGSVVVEAAAKKCEPDSRQSFVEEITLRASSAEAKRGGDDVWSQWFRFGSVPEAKGDFTVRNLDPGRYFLRADLPDEDWYVREVSVPAAVPVAARRTPKKPAESAQNGIAVKSGERLMGVEVKIAEGAASLDGKIVAATESVKPPNRISVHLVPVEADDFWRHAETIAGGDGALRFRHLAPGKYWLLAKPAIEGEPDRPIAWDATARAKLRKEAEAKKIEIELKPCQHLKDHNLRW